MLRCMCWNTCNVSDQLQEYVLIRLLVPMGQERRIRQQQKRLVGQRKSARMFRCAARPYALLFLGQHSLKHLLLNSLPPHFHPFYKENNRYSQHSLSKNIDCKKFNKEAYNLRIPRVVDSLCVTPR